MLSIKNCSSFKMISSVVMLIFCGFSLKAQNDGSMTIDFPESFQGCNDGTCLPGERVLIPFTYGGIGVICNNCGVTTLNYELELTFDQRLGSGIVKTESVNLTFTFVTRNNNTFELIEDLSGGPNGSTISPVASGAGVIELNLPCAEDVTIIDIGVDAIGGTYNRVGRPNGFIVMSIENGYITDEVSQLGSNPFNPAGVPKPIGGYQSVFVQPVAKITGLTDGQPVPNNLCFSALAQYSGHPSFSYHWSIEDGASIKDGRNDRQRVCFIPDGFSKGGVDITLTVDHNNICANLFSETAEQLELSQNKIRVVLADGQTGQLRLNCCVLPENIEDLLDDLLDDVFKKEILDEDNHVYFSVGPNPVVSSLNLFFETEITKPAEATIIDINGRFMDKVSLEPNNSNYRLDFSRFGSGFYTVVVHQNGNIIGTQSVEKF